MTSSAISHGRIASAALACVVTIVAAQPAHAASMAGSGRALIVRPGTLVNSGPLSFGALIPSAAAGTATIATNGTRTVTGGVTMAAGSVSSATFVGMSNPFGFLVNVGAPTPATITLNRVGGGATMTVTNFAVEGGTGLRFVPANTVLTFRVGGQLNVGANQAQGSYNGTFAITVTYF